LSCCCLTIRIPNIKLVSLEVTAIVLRNIADFDIWTAFLDTKETLIAGVNIPWGLFAWTGFASSTRASQRFLVTSSPIPNRPQLEEILIVAHGISIFSTNLRVSNLISSWLHKRPVTPDDRCNSPKHNTTAFDDRLWLP
jgi:hypothetical protein